MLKSQGIAEVERWCSGFSGFQPCYCKMKLAADNVQQVLDISQRNQPQAFLCALFFPMPRIQITVPAITSYHLWLQTMILSEQKNKMVYQKAFRSCDFFLAFCFYVSCTFLLIYWKLLHPNVNIALICILNIMDFYGCNFLFAQYASSWENHQWHVPYWHCWIYTVFFGITYAKESYFYFFFARSCDMLQGLGMQKQDLGNSDKRSVHTLNTQARAMLRTSIVAEVLSSPLRWPAMNCGLESLKLLMGKHLLRH